MELVSILYTFDSENKRRTMMLFKNDCALHISMAMQHKIIQHALYHNYVYANAVIELLNRFYSNCRAHNNVLLSQLQVPMH